MTIYSVQINDNGFPKLVPHTGKKHCEFLNRKKAEEFQKHLKKNNPEDQFRILKTTTTYKPEKWL